MSGDSKRRPSFVSDEEYGDSYERIFSGKECDHPVVIFNDDQSSKVCVYCGEEMKNGSNDDK